MMDNLKSIRKAFKKFFKEHAEVRSYHYGDLPSYTAITDKRYKSVNIEFQNASFPVSTTRLNFNLVVADRMDLGRPETEHDAVADCLQIALDFTAFLYDNTLSYAASNAQPFRQDGGDITAGVVMAFYINIQRNANSCIIPKNVPV